MYKKQLTAQKMICLAAIIVSAIFFLYTLGIMTDLYDSLYDTMRNPSNVYQTDVPGSIVYYNMQEFNRYFLVYSIGQILLGALLVANAFWKANLMKEEQQLVEQGRGDSRMISEERTIQRDRMRFIKNSLSSSLAILGILFDVLYFVSIYQSDVDVYYYNILIGASIVYNLVFMLAVFLSSEGVKNYKKNYSYLLAVIGALQIVRIFIIPMRAHAATTLVNGEPVIVMQGGQFTYVVACLVLSAACLIASAAVNFVRCRELSEHLESLGMQST